MNGADSRDADGPLCRAPVTEFDETVYPSDTNPLTGDRLHYVWGYHPLSFLAL